MDTRALIWLILKTGYAILLWAGILRSLYVGVRYGFRFPRSLHILSVVILIFEAGVLVLYPIPLTQITLLLGSLLLLLPLSPYIGWVVAGGPDQSNANENRPVRKFFMSSKHRS